MKPKHANLAVSVHRRLLDISKAKGEDFQFILTRYALERFLYRLSKSKHSDGFVLKGALLLAIWSGQRYRSTKDLDLLGAGDNSAEHLVQVFRDICHIEVEPDGLVFDSESITATEIRDEQEYGG